MAITHNFNFNTFLVDNADSSADNTVNLVQTADGFETTHFITDPDNTESAGGYARSLKVTADVTKPREYSGLNGWTCRSETFIKNALIAPNFWMAYELKMDETNHFVDDYGGEYENLCQIFRRHNGGFGSSGDFLQIRCYGDYWRLVFTDKTQGGATDILFNLNKFDKNIPNLFVIKCEATYTGLPNEKLKVWHNGRLCVNIERQLTTPEHDITGYEGYYVQPKIGVYKPIWNQYYDVDGNLTEPAYINTPPSIPVRINYVRKWRFADFEKSESDTYAELTDGLQPDRFQ